MSLFVPFLRRLVRYGHLTVVDASGRSHVFGGLPLDGLRPVGIRLHDRRLEWALPMRPALTVGEGYMDGTLTIESGTLYDFLALANENLRRSNLRFAPGEHLATMLRRLQQWNPV
jgi:cyclopropane-fatty-acyl-phospholipid synthase